MASPGDQNAQQGGEAAVRRLPESVRSRLSGANIASFAHAVQEVVLNAVESGAREIHVEMDERASRMSFLVRDDGCGIAEPDMALVGAPHSSSKDPGLGYAGNSLAGIAQVSVLEVSSRRSGAWVPTISKTLAAGSEVATGLAKKQKASSGTTVSVRDLFFNMPVRRKQHADARAQSDGLREWLLALAAAHPPLGISLYDAAASKQLLQIKPGRSREATEQLLFGDRKTVRFSASASVNGGDLLVTGCAVEAPHGATSRAAQHVYVNQRPVRAPDVARLVGKLFSACIDSFVQYYRIEHPAASGAARYPAYCAFIRCPPSCVDVVNSDTRVYAEARFLSDVRPALHAAVQHAFVEQAWARVAPAALLRETRDRAPGSAPHDSAQAMSISGHGGLESLAGGAAEASSELAGTLLQPAPRPSSPAARPSRKRRRRPLEVSQAWQPGEQNAGADALRDPGAAAFELRRLRNPSSQAIDAGRPHPTTVATVAGWRQVHASSGAGTHKARNPASAPAAPAARSDVLAGLLTGWHDVGRGVRDPPIRDAASLARAAAAPAAASRPVERAQLAQLEALGQLDDKFIVAAGGGVVCVVDQHAADERVRLEELQDAVLGPGGVPKDRQVFRPPVPSIIEVTQQEWHLLQEHDDAVRRWGWDWSAQQSSAEAGHRTVSLSGLPRVAGQVLGGTHLLLYLHELAASSARAVPPGVKQALDSRACRTAIMFGDRLSRAECAAVLGGLKTCRQWTICAHGRCVMGLTDRMCHSALDNAV
ncbi:unnamed protein product [Pedinophyceae sp. YPF-701]|nr:unnamed protein product [Pedinophyceae sp. YPF-701]